jgi:HlyD family secretion protein
VGEAKAALDVIDVQLAKLTVSAPLDGVVLVRSVEPGEVLVPGGSAISIGRLSDLHITVYISEDQYGQIKLGDEAEVQSDSFPGRSFTAEVVRIADQAEFTPRNVQTQEDRSTTVYAVELSLSDGAGDLKPGMPVDVTFGG